MQEIQQHMPGAVAEPPKVNFTFNGQDMADPEVKAFFEKVEGLPPGQPSNPRPRTGSGGGNGTSAPSGGGAAMRNSNAEATRPQEPENKAT